MYESESGAQNSKKPLQHKLSRQAVSFIYIKFAAFLSFLQTKTL